MHHQAIPPEVMSAQEKKAKQTTLNGVAVKINILKEFTPKQILHSVAQFVACDDQVSQ